MSNVRRVTVKPWGSVDEVSDMTTGNYALLPWSEYEVLLEECCQLKEGYIANRAAMSAASVKFKEEIERLRSVVAELREEIRQIHRVIAILGGAEFFGGKWRFRNPDDQMEWNALEDEP